MKNDSTLDMQEYTQLHDADADIAGGSLEPVGYAQFVAEPFHDSLSSHRSNRSMTVVTRSAETDEDLSDVPEGGDFRVKVTLGLLWLRLIEAGDVHAMAARDRLLRCCTDFKRESICSAFSDTSKADIIRAQVLGAFILDYRRNHAARILLQRLSRSICL